MTGQHIRKKIKEKGYTFRSIAQAMGESDQNLRRLLLSDNIKTETLERVAAAMQVPVAYFYEQQPILTMVEYGEYMATRRENEMLKQLLNEKDQRIELLQRQKK